MSCSCCQNKKDSCCGQNRSLLWQEPSGLRLLLAAFVTVTAWALPATYNTGIWLYVAAYLLCGGNVLVRAVSNLLKGDFFDENSLMTLATLGAFAIGDYPEAVAVMLFYQVGELVQDRAVDNSRRSIEQVLALRPQTVCVKRDTQLKIVDPETVQIGETLIVKPGERIALDGKVIDGTSQIDMSALTGEHRPILAKTGSEVWAGGVVIDGVISVIVQKNYQNSAIAKIVELTEQATEKKSVTEKFITRFARIYTPIVVMSAVLLALVPPLIFQAATFRDWGYRALVFLVLSCPCAFVLSVPLGFFCGLGNLAKHGVLVKGSTYLERLARLATLAFDKTGTLTEGVFEVTDVRPQPGVDARELLSWAAQAELYSNHPIGKALVRAADGTILNPDITSQQEVAGEGMIAGPVVVGSRHLLERLQINVPVPPPVETCVYVAYEQVFKGVILLGDKIKPEASDMIRQLQQGLVKQIVLLSGDAENAVIKTARELGVAQGYGGLLPGGKVAKLEEIIANEPAGYFTGFVGDGINDAPVLARADVSLAMGGLGSDAAIEAADVVLMTDELTKIATAIRVAKHCLRVVKQNIYLAFGIKIIVLALGLVGMATLWMAVFADVGVSVLAVTNSLRVFYSER